MSDSISSEYTCTEPWQNIRELSSSKESGYQRVGFTPVMPSEFQILHINKRKTHTIAPIDADKAFNKIQHPFRIKNTQQVRNRGELPPLDEGHLQNRTANNVLSGDRLEASPAGRRGTLACPPSRLWLTAPVPAGTIRHEKEGKAPAWRERGKTLCMYR